MRRRKIYQHTYIEDIDTDENYSGVIPRTIHELFNLLLMPEYVAKKYSIYCSFLQIYNEKIYDLLTESKYMIPLELHENRIDGIFVAGL